MTYAATPQSCDSPSTACDPNLADVEERIAALESLVERVASPQEVEPQQADRASIVVFSGEMDKLMAAFVMATGAAAMGTRVSMFFTFWGLTALKKRTVFRGKSLTAKLMAAMLPRHPSNLPLSRMNLIGFGPELLKRVMQSQHVQSLPELIELAQELEVELSACDMAMRVMGIAPEELIDGVKFCGAATYLENASRCRINLFI